MKISKSVSVIALIIFCAIVGFAQNKSVYTDLEAKKCKTVEQSSEGAGWYRGECAGVGGYKLEVTEGDLRQSINVIAPNKKKFELDFSQVSSGFSSVGAKAEWRMKGKTPVALIVRFNASENPEDSSKITSYLIVAKIGAKESCIVDVVKPGKNQNADAQKTADAAASKACKTFE